MARTAKITNDQILEVARTIFLEEGFSAPTSKIARRAQISEGTIFKRFTTKEALFFAALEIEPSPAWHAEIDRCVGTGDILENLKMIFLSILTYYNEMLPRSIMTMGNMGFLLSQWSSLSKAYKDGEEHHVITADRKLRVFLEREIELGRLRVYNADELAKVILGLLTSHILRSLAQGESLKPEAFHEIAESSAELIWNGIAPTTCSNELRKET